MPNVAFLKYGEKLGLRPGSFPLEKLDWPLGEPEGLAGKSLRDLGPEDHLIMLPQDLVHFRPGFGIKAKVSILVMEPGVIHGKHMRKLRWSHRLFYKVLTCNEDLLSRIPNGAFFPAGDTWAGNWKTADRTKTKMCSLIASNKRSQEGHKLRHDMVEWIQTQGLDVDVMGRGYKPFEEKIDGLAPYRFSIVIENVRERNYFTEKLIDALLCSTVPIYWGCPNIRDFFDTNAMIICETAEEVRVAVQNMSAEHYEQVRPALDASLETALYYAKFKRRAAEAVLAG
ncbi:Glycosyltransferase family 10 (fucosyltransferase) [Roseovarius albus]|uniref:Glycosyltransferase family 10 (Fucosyltransferase) n=1 Tax=Roseovarius albus TaxID=1247867 RepID=A0A1X6YQL0_9RHOB|nr:glycosyltransferase family 10 [Roseovarius albus]SLN28395.1 Glycosyltransferase family 10 (fucosyltransferase) [Roseovarius albus]